MLEASPRHVLIGAGVPDWRDRQAVGHTPAACLFPTTSLRSNPDAAGNSAGEC